MLIAVIVTMVMSSSLVFPPFTTANNCLPYVHVYVVSFLCSHSLFAIEASWKEILHTKCKNSKCPARVEKAAIIVSPTLKESK